jgi:hypothetical protein
MNTAMTEYYEHGSGGILWTWQWRDIMNTEVAEYYEHDRETFGSRKFGVINQTIINISIHTLLHRVRRYTWLKKYIHTIRAHYSVSTRNPFRWHFEVSHTEIQNVKQILKAYPLSTSFSTFLKMVLYLFPQFPSFHAEWPSSREMSSDKVRLALQLTLHFWRLTNHLFLFSELYITNVTDKTKSIRNLRGVLGKRICRKFASILTLTDNK